MENFFPSIQAEVDLFVPVFHVQLYIEYITNTTVHVYVQVMHHLKPKLSAKAAGIMDIFTIQIPQYTLKELFLRFLISEKCFLYKTFVFPRPYFTLIFGILHS